MSHFMGMLEGSRGPASRLGTKQSGLRVRGTGWEIGGEIEMASLSNTQDAIRFTLDGGSNRPRGRMIAEATDAPEGRRIVYYHPVTGEPFAVFVNGELIPPTPTGAVCSRAGIAAKMLALLERLDTNTTYSDSHAPYHTFGEDEAKAIRALIAEARVP